MCMYVRVAYIYIYVCTYACMYVRVHAYAYVRIYVFAHSANTRMHTGSNAKSRYAPSPKKPKESQGRRGAGTTDRPYCHMHMATRGLCPRQPRPMINIRTRTAAGGPAPRADSRQRGIRSVPARRCRRRGRFAAARKHHGRIAARDRAARQPVAPHGQHARPAAVAACRIALAGAARKFSAYDGATGCAGGRRAACENYGGCVGVCAGLCA